MKPIRISPELRWLLPFVEAARPLCNVDRIEVIRGYAVQLGMSEQQSAAIHVDPKTHKATICIKVMNHVNAGIIVTHRKPAFISEVLDCLAHELAHLHHWEHTPNHYRLQAGIMRRFAMILKSQGIRDTWARMKLPRSKKWRRGAD